jgi:hypothetical protein
VAWAWPCPNIAGYGSPNPASCFQPDPFHLLEPRESVVLVGGERPRQDGQVVDLSPPGRMVLEQPGTLEEMRDIVRGRSAQHGGENRSPR